MATNKVISAGTGRRKTACARVTLMQGEGKWTVNRVALEEYITSEALRDYLKQPIAISGFDATNVDVVVFAKGGGCSGQAGAIRHGLARALVAASSSRSVNRYMVARMPGRLTATGRRGRSNLPRAAYALLEETYGIWIFEEVGCRSDGQEVRRAEERQGATGRRAAAEERPRQAW